MAFAFPDGREVFALRFARQAFAAICLDDLGYRWEAAKRVVALPCKLTCAVIPLTPHARAVASLAAAGGKEVFLHMPMASRGRMPEVPEYGMMVRGGQTDPQVRANLARAFANLPNAVGMNNHEGSLATEDRVLMAAVMTVVKERGLVFLDSGTTVDSVAWRVARDAGVRWAKRDVFLDDPMPKPAVEAAFARLVALARSRGRAIGIGHPHPSTLDVLERRIPEAQARGIVFVPVSALAAMGR